MFRVPCFGHQVSGFGCWDLGFGVRVSCRVLRVSRVSGIRFRVSGAGYRLRFRRDDRTESRQEDHEHGRIVEHLFRALSFGSRVSGFGFRVSSFGFRVSGFRFRVSGPEFRVSGFGFRSSSFGFEV